MTDFQIKQHDALPLLIANLKTSSGETISLSASNVYFKMKASEGIVLTVNALANVTNASLGTVQYEWNANDTANVGNFLAEWEINYDDGNKQTIPTQGFINIVIYDDLD